ncbi:F0F1 ATP synthase subunit delta [Gallaecimonas kandeliae]|uniref:F0F1 ATP synthase subunit delta n=1 Tax=Gallaecimonas kandeliae TaxID=3029055 RepID=UPI0026474588|nr:F0F1 ATP synthase subunit delta [Gallaecimonas kandeliae]WKE65645.1 F0F1 ATP synthase subunit delta [Gallaecimonas kandeliae]
MSELTTVARPYAKAAFDFAVEKAAVDQWAAMLHFAGEVAKHDKLQALFASNLSTGHKADALIQICGEQLDANGQNLVKVMAENERLSALPAVAELYAELRHEYAQEVQADVKSAVALSADEQSKLSAALEKRLARKVKLNCSIDPSLISGTLVQVGDQVIDSSVKGKLGRMAHRLQS